MKGIKDSLEMLHNELQNTEQLDQESIDMLQNLMNDIRSILERSGVSSPEEHHNILEGLKDSAQKFEVSHPELAGAISIVINSFSNIGA